MHGNINPALPDVTESVLADTRLEVSLHTGRHDPNVMTGTSDEVGLRRMAVVSLISFLSRRNEGRIWKRVLVGSHIEKGLSRRGCVRLRMGKK